MVIQIVFIFFNLMLGIFVLCQKPKSTNNRIFSVMSFVAALWATSNYLDDISSATIWIRCSYALGALVVCLGLIWTLYITNKKLEAKTYLPVIFITLFLCVGSFLPNFIFKSYHKDALHSIPFGNPGWGLILYLIFYLIGSFIIISKLKKSKEKSVHNVYYGALITLVVTLLSSFILPFFSIFPFGVTDNMGFLIFQMFIVYSITRHHLFNIRVIAIEIVTCALWFTVLIRILLAPTQKEMIIGCAFLATTVIFGILLIRSTLNEIKQQEQIEKLSKELQKVYADRMEDSANINVAGPAAS